MLIEQHAHGYHIGITGSRSLPAIVFLHGFLGSGNDWLACATSLGNRFCSVLPDLPGHGRTTDIIPGPHPFEAITDELACVVGSLPFQQVHLVGYSMGGRLTLALMLTRPELIKSATIISSSPGLKDEGSRIERAKRDDQLAIRIREDFPRFLDDWYSMPMFAPLKESPAFPALIEARLKNNPENLGSSLQDLSTGRQPSYWEKLRNNRIPVRFFAGEKDTKYVEIGRQMVNLCPCSGLEIFPGCGHTLHIENRGLFLQRLLYFLNTQENQNP